jgi:hypothetical protein
MKTRGVNLCKALERLRYEVNRPQKNALIDAAIVQVEADQAKTLELVTALETARSILMEYVNSERCDHSNNVCVCSEVSAIEKIEKALESYGLS